MVATGYNNGNNEVIITRILEAMNDVTVEKCTHPLPAYPLKVRDAAGTTLSNGEPLICGGYVDGSPDYVTDKCYKLGTHKWREAPPLPSGRRQLAMTSTEATTFISGGRHEDQGGYPGLNDFHQLHGGSWQPLTPLPIKLWEHCLVAINSTHLLNIGGLESVVGSFSYRVSK